MQAAMRSLATTGVTLAATGLVAAVPAAPTPPAVGITDPAVALTADAGDLGNIVDNLFYDVVNIPANELNALNELANSAFFAGTWLVSSPTNLWGWDVGDTPKLDSIIDVLLPFPALADPLKEQLNYLMAAEVPSNADCDTILCVADPDLLGGYNDVSLAELLDGYTFPEDGPTVENPLGSVDDAWGFEGTHEGPDGEPVMPWAGDEFTFEPLQPFEEYFDHLTTPVDGSFDVPDLGELLVTPLKLAEAATVPFNPLLPPGPLPEGDNGLVDLGDLSSNLTPEGIADQFDALLDSFLPF